MTLKNNIVLKPVASNKLYQHLCYTNLYMLVKIIITKT